ncbi:MAG: nitroreductase family protein [Candidatus Omnitrophica bacterium]|nr:nitroreductase family protein [Candidatus Omnitrophota bacterium]MCM8809208.1 nitroreductase family protein [Candidatus Omnitrophota bacterium]MCM8811021.1 nitroreductase family protein [Candidatus Omnitrophota bacterium]
MDIYEIIRKRRTIRRFKQKEIPIELLEKFVDMARLAPSGANMQPLEYIIVNDKNLVDEIFPLTGWAGYLGKDGPPPQGKRPVAYIVILINKDIKSPTPKHDSGASVENILLSATYEGIGSCWIGSINRDKLREILEIPENYEIDTIIALGYPDEESIIEEFDGSIKYWKDEKGIMHVPKRKLKDILHFNKF